MREDAVAHPSKDIIGSKGAELKGRKITLCVTGSVAAVQAPEIARELMRRGAEVFTVMSHQAQKIIHPHLMEWATGNPVVTEITGKIEHVALAGCCEGKSDLILISPATANTISKVACGVDDTPVTTVASTAFGSKTPIIVVPAMHESMYKHPILLENMKKLKVHGVVIVEPRIEEGKAKIVQTEKIVDAVVCALSPKKFSGIKFLITAGPTVAYIDPVRILTNKSTGKMGVAIAEKAVNQGAHVTLIYGKMGTAVPPGNVQAIPVETTEQMLEAVASELGRKEYDVVVSAAAPADWTPKKPSSRKVSTEKPELTVKLRPTRKIIGEVRKAAPDTFLVAFKADFKSSEKELVEHALQLLKKADANLVVANDVGRRDVGFRFDTNEVFVVNREGVSRHIPFSPKSEVALKLLDIILMEMRRCKSKAGSK